MDKDTCINMNDKRADKNSTSARSTSSEKAHATIIFSLKKEVGALAKALKYSQDKQVNIVPVESCKSRQENSDFEIDLDSDSSPEPLKEMSQHLKLADLSDNATLPHDDMVDEIWFPKKISDLDLSANRIITIDYELKSDHPGFTDDSYHERRKYFNDLAISYKHGNPIPRVDFTEEEVRTWGVVFREVSKVHPTHACKEFLNSFSLLIKYCNYRDDTMPQLEDISNFLKERSGFILRPVAGFLSSRDFLAGLAFRVFHCTQYMRHSSNCLFTPEPDTCHELLGHIPMLTDPCFAEFSQEIGLASLGASDDDIKKLAHCYVFTVEFGLCKQEGKLKAFGAGLLSSVRELKYAMSDEAHTEPFEPVVTCIRDYAVDTFQDVYYISDSFEDATTKMREFAKTMRRPFTISYNPYTQSVDILRDSSDIGRLVKNIQHELDIVEDALSRLAKVNI
ncbi:tryptophan 5-hydroxylase 1-like [Genypterus blacodes]|uniref:tryptophan 5-hydroxylase 1-like n=1 Tax=Genypterus blacodes TaxID=154954 RepID=UPI003F7676D5